ncbi:BTAD domain-containing putative transcriptional regulator [Microbispora sp. CSR-4]|uniref:BTAD domain-containing putative transcriptional regulator n=1 Tax=Microbispora sp. CSR-4 TaxID=2592813 RepID=UPI0011C80FA2|nr:BTAD domain-containing putative transcriptional regulator [Microbispora sp. CSR-4]
MVRLRVLGRIAAEVDGRPADLGTSLQRAVLARLVCARGHVVSTDRFVDDLWRGQPPPRALGALQVYVSNLRRALEPGRAPRAAARVLVTTPPGYRLALEPGDVDAWRFPRLVESAAGLLTEGRHARALEVVDEALALWTGQAYAEFGEEEWAVPEVVHLDELRAVAVEYRAEAGLALARHGEVVPELERHLTAHPLRENAVRLLALAYYRAGRQGEALAVLRRTRDQLADQLGIDPGPALRALEADILAQAESLDATPVRAIPVPSAAQHPVPAPVPAPAPAPAPAGDFEPVRMVGRTAELSRLAAAAERARAGFRIAWLGGEAGSGKSTLADALVRRLSADGWQTVIGRCPETTGGVPPAWAWSEVLRELSAACPPEPGTAARLAPLLTDDAAPVGQFWLARAAGDYLDGVPGPLLIVLEDVHRADEETLQLLRHLAGRLTRTPVLVLLTHRPAEAGDDLTATRAALAVQAVENITLGGLGEREVARLLAERSGTEVDEATVRTVTERTGGNPLFVTETARLLAVDGPSAAHALPPGVRDLIRRRLARLPATARTTLRNAAVLGREADADVLIAMPGADEESVLDGLEAGVLSGLLEEPRPGRVRFAHVLVRETLYEDIPRLRRTRMHGKALAALERVRPGDVGALGHHALAAATTATALTAAEYAARAAGQATALYAHKEAAALLEGALGALDLVSEGADGAGRDLRLDLLCRLVSAQSHAGDVITAVRNRTKALAVARQTEDRGAVARAVSSLDAPVIWTIQPDRVLDADLVEAIEEALPAEAGELRCRMLVALCHALEGHDAARIEAASAEALAIADALGDPRLRCMALNGRYWVCLTPERRDDLERLGHDLLAASAAAGLLGYQTLGHFSLLMAALGRNDWATARRHADKAMELSTSGQLGLALGILAFLDAVHLLVRGEFERAESAYTQLGERLASTGDANGAMVGTVGRFVVTLAAGRVHESVEELAALWERLPQDVGELYTRALVGAGRLEEARVVWASARVPRRDYYWLVFLSLRADNAIALGHRAEAEECYRLLLPSDGELAGLHSGSVTLGPVAHTLGDLAAFLGRSGDAGAHYLRAAEVARQAGSPHWEEAARREADNAALMRSRRSAARGDGGRGASAPT